jgi:DNA-binding transcriptional LysR family regulator
MGLTEYKHGSRRLVVANGRLPSDHRVATTRTRAACRRARVGQGQAFGGAAEAESLLKDGHCLREHALSFCRLADRRCIDTFECTILGTVVQMVENGLGITLLPTLATESGLLCGTNLVTRPLLLEGAARKIGLIWRSSTRRRNEFRLLGREIAARSKPHTKSESYLQLVQS